MDIKVTNKLENNNVEVTLKKNNITLKYKLPEEKSDAFIQATEKQVKKASWIVAPTLIGSCIAGTLVTGKFVKSTGIKKLLVCCAGGIVAYISSAICASKIINQNDKKFLKKYSAIEIKNSNTKDG